MLFGHMLQDQGWVYVYVYGFHLKEQHKVAHNCLELDRKLSMILFINFFYKKNQKCLVQKYSASFSLSATNYL